MSWRVCLYAFLVLHLPQPLACTDTCLGSFITFLPTACSGFLPQFSAEGSGCSWGSTALVHELLTHSPSKPSHVPPAWPHHGQLQQEPNRWLLIPAGNKVCIQPSCSPQRRDMSAVIKSKWCDLHKPTQLFLCRLESSTGVGTSRRAARWGNGYYSLWVRVSILKIKPPKLCFAIWTRGLDGHYYLQHHSWREDPWQ